MRLDLKGHTALVTGAERSTGAAIADALAEAGAQVIGHSNSGDAVADSLPHQVSGNLADDAGCSSVLDQLGGLELPIDIVVNNYGTAGPGQWGTTDSTAWLDMYQKNVLSVARLTQALLPDLRARGWGRIVNLGTIGSHRPQAVMPHYYAAKGALATLGVSLCQALAGTGVTVNTVSPGLIHTPDLEAGYRRKAAKLGWGDNWGDIVQHIVREDFPNPCERLATREEIASLVVFLCSQQAGFINGQNIRIDGGALLWV